MATTELKTELKEEITQKMVVLKSSDDEEFTLEKSVGEQSVTIKNMVEDLDGDDTSSSTLCIPLPIVEGGTLTKVIEYLKMHDTVTTKFTKEELKKFDKEFIEGMGMGMVFEVILAANYLNIKDLLDLSCQKVADHIKNKSPAYVRKFFNIENDFTKEEEEDIIKESQWAFEGVDPDED